MRATGDLRRTRRARRGLVFAVAAAALVASGPAEAVHFYRGTGGGCAEAAGTIGATGQTPDATVLMLHNSYHDSTTGGPVTRIQAGQTVEWQWSSAHCHSATAAGVFDSGFLYPTEAPESPQAVPGLVEYPVPDLTPALAYRYTFDAPGTYTYACVHHAAIGMVGTVIVE